MTKSIKEKDRIAKIKEHELSGTKITSDLLKIRLVYEKASRKRKSGLFRRRIVSGKLVHQVFNNFFKENINNLMVDIASNIRLYEFKLSIRACNINLFSKSSKRGIALYLSIDTIRNKHIGNLHCENNEMMVMNRYSNIKNKEETIYTLQEILESFNEPLQLMLNLNIQKSYFNDSLNPRLKQLNNKVINEFIHNFAIAKNKYKDLKKDISTINEHDVDEPNDYRLQILVNKEFCFRFTYETGFGLKNNDIHPFKEYNHMLYFKMIIESIYPNIEIPDEYYTEENVEEIKAIAKMSGY
jgi:hypothetical protein